VSLSGPGEAEPQPPTQPHEVDAPTATKPSASEPVEEKPLSASKSEPAAQTTPILPQAATATPSPKLTGRPVVSHRSGARHKTTDQPVVMPSSFGPGVEKVGMQFGSLGLGGESLLDPNS